MSVPVRFPVAPGQSTDVAPAPPSDKLKVRLCVHPVQNPDGSPRTHRDQCYVVSVDGRWLFNNDGRLTILKGIKAVRGFMRLIKMSCYESGEPAQIKSDCGNGAYRIAAGPHQPPDGSVRTH